VQPRGLNPFLETILQSRVRQVLAKLKRIHHQNSLLPVRKARPDLKKVAAGVSSLYLFPMFLQVLLPADSASGRFQKNSTSGNRR
jgi:hypothetical protein